MHNLAMKQLLEKGEAIDVSSCERNEDGHYILSQLVEDVDYCDAKREVWIWSIGRNFKTGQILASTGTEFYLNNDYKCLWLR